MRHVTRTRGTAAAAAAAAVLLAVGVASAAPAAASGSSGGGGVERRGDCTKSSEWRLKASPDNGRIQVEAEIDSDVKGQRWTWRMLHNGSTSASGGATTQSGGSFTVKRAMIDVPGLDRIGVRATNAATGESCSGNLSY